MRSLADDSVPTPVGIDALSVAFAYDDESRRLLLAAKNGGRRDALAQLGRSLAAVVAPHAPGIDAVTWVPASAARRRQRGYDQGEVLAGVVGRSLGLRPVRLLRRRRGEAQAGQDRVGRLAGPTLQARRRAPSRVLVVDDVMTTGASLAAAATTLRAAGSHSVRAAVVAAAVDPMGFTGDQHRLLGGELDIGGRTWT